MIIFYDILLLDDIKYIFELYEHRRQHLQVLINSISGYAELGEREKMDTFEGRTLLSA